MITERRIVFVLEALRRSCADDRRDMFSTLLGAIGQFAADSEDPAKVLRTLVACVESGAAAIAFGTTDERSLERLLEQKLNPS